MNEATLCIVGPSHPFALLNNFLELQEVKAACLKATVIFSHSALKYIITISVYLGTLLYIHSLLRKNREPVTNKDWEISDLVLSHLARSGLQLEMVA